MKGLSSDCSKAATVLLLINVHSMIIHGMDEAC